MHALLLALSLAYPASPQCSGGTAWVSYQSDPPAMLMQAKCDGCKAVCDKVGTKSEGWYSSCDGSLIQWTMCGTREPVACTMDAKLCPDGKTYVGRDGNNNCEWQKCPSEEVCTQEECGPAMGMPSRLCLDGSTVGPVCSRDSETGKCSYHIEECRMLQGPSCDPYVCADGTKVDACAEDGTVINYFAAPCLTHGGEAKESFLDVNAQHENADAIDYVKQRGIVRGYEDGTYKPDQKINRAEFTKIVIAAQYSQAEIDDCPLHGDVDSVFSDMRRTDWFVPYVCTARLHDVIAGYPDRTFRPTNSINFVEAAKIIVKAFGLEATSTIPACEGDCPWYRDFVMMLEMRGAIPTSITAFDHPITRGEMAEMIYRLQTGNASKASQTYDDLLVSNAPNVLSFLTVQEGDRIGAMTVTHVEQEGAYGEVVLQGSVTIPVRFSDNQGATALCFVWDAAKSEETPYLFPVQVESPGRIGNLPVCVTRTEALNKRIPIGSMGTAVISLSTLYVVTPTGYDDRQQVTILSSDLGM